VHFFGHILLAHTAPQAITAYAASDGGIIRSFSHYFSPQNKPINATKQREDTIWLNIKPNRLDFDKILHFSPKKTGERDAPFYIITPFLHNDAHDVLRYGALALFISHPAA